MSIDPTPPSEAEDQELRVELGRATIRDPLGNRTEVDLQNLRRNQKLDGSLFVFQRPPGTDVIEAPEP